MKHLWIDFLGTGTGLAAAALMFRVAFWGEPPFWRLALWLMGFLGAIWLVEGTLLLVIGWQQWRGRRAR